MNHRPAGRFADGRPEGLSAKQQSRDPSALAIRRGCAAVTGDPALRRHRLPGIQTAACRATQERAPVFVSERDLAAKLSQSADEQSAGEAAARLAPLRAVVVVRHQYRARIRHVVQIEIRTKPGLSEGEDLAEPQIEDASPILELGPRRDQRNGHGGRAVRSRSARRRGAQLDGRGVAPLRRR